MKVLLVTLLYLTSTMAIATNISTQEQASTEPYRGLPYHAPTTLTPPNGVKRISVDELRSCLARKQKPVLIDVYGAIFREESLDFDGAWLVSTPHKSLPDSTWLPNVGKQELIPVVEDYYRFHLKELTGNDLSKTLVIFCVEDCWMGWNAAKRAREWGYTNVMWFREGIDAWKEKGWPLHDIEPINLPVND